MSSTIQRLALHTGSRRSWRHGKFTLAALAIVTAGAASAAGEGQPDAQARYQQERAACLGGKSQQDSATCLREAGAALQEARRGQLSGADAAQEQNRMLRCESVAAPDREDCMRRMRGEATVSGSMESGGVYRELRTTVPAQ